MALSAGAVRVDFIADGSGFYRVSGDVLNRTQRLRLGMVRAARAIRRHWRGVAIAIAGVGVAIGAGIKKMTEYSSTLVESARASGVAVKELENLRALLRGDGLEATAADTAFIALNNRLGKAKQGYGEAIRSFEKYGITVRKVNGEFKSTSELMRDVAGVIRTVNDQSIAATIGFDLFGDQGRRIASIIRNMEGDFDTATSAAGRFNTLTEEQHEQNKELKQSLDDFLVSLWDFAMRVLAAATPQLTVLLDKWTEWLEQVKASPRFIKNVEDAVRELTSSFSDLYDMFGGIVTFFNESFREHSGFWKFARWFGRRDVEHGFEDKVRSWDITPFQDYAKMEGADYERFLKRNAEKALSEYKELIQDARETHEEFAKALGGDVVAFEETPQYQEMMRELEVREAYYEDVLERHRDFFIRMRKEELDYVKERSKDVKKEAAKEEEKMIFPPMHEIQASSKMAHMGMGQWWLSRDDNSGAIAKEYVRMRNEKIELDKWIDMQRQIMRAWDEISMFGLYFRETPNVGLGAMESRDAQGMWPNIASAYPQMPSQIGGGQIDYQPRWQDFTGADPQMAFGLSERQQKAQEYYTLLRTIGSYESRLAVARGQQLEDDAAMYDERAQMIKDYHTNLEAIGGYESRLAFARGLQLEDDALRLQEIADLQDDYYTTLRENGTYAQRMAVIRGQQLAEEADELQRIADLTKLWNDRLVQANASFETRMAGAQALWNTGMSYDSITDTMTRMADEIDKSKGKTNELRDAFMNMGNSIVDNFDNMSDALRNFARELVKIGIQRHLLNPAADFLFGPANGGDGGLLGSLFGATFPAGADGGMFGKGMTLVGERGPELVDFASPGRVYTNEQLSKAISGAGKGVNITYNISSTDGPGVRKALAEATPGIVRMAESSVADRASRPGPYRQQLRGRA